MGAFDEMDLRHSGHHQHLFSPAITRLSEIQLLSATDLIVHVDAAGIRRAVVFSVAYQLSNPNRPPLRTSTKQ